MVGSLVGICRGVRRHRRWLAALLLLLTVLGGWRAAHLDRDNTLEAWLAPDDPALRAYQEFRDRYAVSDPLMFYLPGTAAEQAFETTRRLRALPGVARADVLGFDVPPAGEPAACAITVTPTPTCDRRSLGLLAVSAPAVVAEVLPGVRCHTGGVWWITHQLDHGSDRAARTFFPLAFLLLALMSRWLIGDTWETALALAAGSLPALLVSAAMELAGQPLNVVLVSVPPLTLILGITYSIHLLVQSRSAGGDRATVMGHVLLPSVAAAGTTVLGFASLLATRLEAVRELGLWGGVGVVLSFVTALVLVPGWARERGRNGRESDGGAGPGLLGRVLVLLAWLHRRPRAVLGLGVVTIALALLGMTRLETESHILNFFQPGDRLRSDYEAIEGAGIGLTPVEIDLPLAGQAFQQQRDWLSELAEARPEVTHILWPLDGGSRLRMIEATSRGAFLTASALPEDRSAPAFARTSDSPRLPGRRVTLLIRTLSTQGTIALIEGIERDLLARLGAAPPARITGSVSLLVRMQALLFQTQLTSFSTAFFSIALVMALVLRSLQLGLLAIIPNVVPVLYTLGVMGAIGVPLDVATVTVASISFSVIVDDTIHFLHGYREHRAGGVDAHGAIGLLMADTGRAMVAVTAVTGISFLAFLASPFLPLRYFGLLISLTFFSGLACDLVFTPCLLLVLAGKGHRA